MSGMSAAVDGERGTGGVTTGGETIAGGMTAVTTAATETETTAPETLATNPPAHAQTNPLPPQLLRPPQAKP